MGVFEKFIWSSLLIGIVAGLIAGLMSHFFIELRENKKWESSKKAILKEYNSILNKILLILRIKAGYENLGIHSEQELIKFLKEKITGNKLKNDLWNSIDSKNQKILISELRGAEEECSSLIALLLSFSRVKNWYVERIFEIKDDLRGVRALLETFPEVGNESCQNRNINSLRENVFSDLVNIAQKTIKTKEELSSKDRT
jgi:hypothetical protein